VRQGVSDGGRRTRRGAQRTQRARSSPGRRRRPRRTFCSMRSNDMGDAMKRWYPGACSSVTGCQKWRRRSRRRQRASSSPSASMPASPPPGGCGGGGAAGAPNPGCAIPAPAPALTAPATAGTALAARASACARGPRAPHDEVASARQTPPGSAAARRPRARLPRPQPRAGGGPGRQASLLGPRAPVQGFKARRDQAPANARLPGPT